MMKLLRLLFGCLALFLIFIFGSCNMKDNFMELCYEPYLIMVKIDINDERQADFSGYDEFDISLMREVKDVILYVFDNDNKYLGYHLTKLNKLTALPYNDFDSIKVISICIDKDLSQWTDILNIGNYYQPNDVFIKLSQIENFNSVNTVISPNDFMFDRKHFGRNPNNDKNVVYYMYVTSKVGAMKIHTKGLESWANITYGKTNKDKDDFKIIVGNTFDSYDFLGILKGEFISYNPDCHILKYDSIKTPMFNLFPTIAQKGVKIDIYRNDEHIYPGAKISKVYLFPIESGWCTDVFMDFDASGGVSIDVEGWGNVDIEIEL